MMKIVFFSRKWVFFSRNKTSIPLMARTVKSIQFKPYHWTEQTETDHNDYTVVGRKINAEWIHKRKEERIYKTKNKNSKRVVGTDYTWEKCEVTIMAPIVISGFCYMCFLLFFFCFSVAHNLENTALNSNVASQTATYEQQKNTQ